MVASAFTAPHATVYLTVDVTPTLELIDRFRADPRLEGHRIGILAVVAKACLIAWRRTPEVNSRWDAEAGQVVEFGFVNLGIAVATPRGLMVPNIRDADSLALPALADELAALREEARGGSVSPAQLSGGTFTITNVGVFGVDTGTPILTPGEAAILAMGRIHRQPWEHDGDIALRSVMQLSLSFDHRLVDGRAGSLFLADVGAILADPASVLGLV
jgi:2-oxoisovalerate dehydrogenase E2 component (dihydrolipoyl transacylase)